MIFPGDFVSQYVSRVPASPGDLELEVLFEDHASTKCLHLSGRPAGGASQRNLFSQHCRGTADGNLAATVDLPPHSALFSLQLLDLAHRWSEREDNDIHIFDVLPLAATAYIPPDPQQPARPLADLLTAIARLLARRQPHNAPLLHTAWTIQQIVTEEYRILGVINYELPTHTPAA